MADIAGSSSVLSKDQKPVIVRVKRKAFQSPFEAFWLEIHERPLKRPLVDIEKLSISDDSSRKEEELKTKKVFVQLVETINSSEVTIDILQSFVPKSADGYEKSKAKNEERRRTFKTENKQDQLLVKAKQKQEVLSKNARFEQIWRSRKGKKEAMRDYALHEMCHVYDVVRVDVEETKEVHEQDDTDLEDHRIMASYLPLLREFIPSAAVEIESDIHDYMSKRASKDDYVYDFYAVKDDINITEEDASNPFPLVQVDDDDEFYCGPIAFEDESDDSNAEDNPLNDYPDEETSEDDGDDRSRPSNDDSEELDSESASNKSSEVEVSDHHNWLEYEDPMYEDHVYGGNGDGDYYDDDVDGDNDDWKWSYR